MHWCLILRRPASDNFGTERENASSVADNVLVARRSTAHNELISVLELDVGAEYARRFGRLLTYVQAGFLGQVWIGAGNSSNVDSIPVMVDPEVSDSSTSLGFLGFKIEAGVRW